MYRLSTAVILHVVIPVIKRQLFVLGFVSGATITIYKDYDYKTIDNTLFIPEYTTITTTRSSTTLLFHINMSLFSITEFLEK